VWCTPTLIPQQFLGYNDLQKRKMLRVIVENDVENKSNAGQGSVAPSDAYTEIVQKQW